MSPLQATPASQTSSFFRLSPELRNIIYSETIEPGQVLFVAAGHPYKLESKPATISAIAQVCQQMRNEALPMFYGNNIFCVSLIKNEDVARANLWATTIGKADLLKIRTIVFHGEANDYYRTTVMATFQRWDDGSADVTASGDSILFQGKHGVIYGPLSRMQPYVQNNWPGRKPVSSVGTLKALIRTFHGYAVRAPSEKTRVELARTNACPIRSGRTQVDVKPRQYRVIED